MDDPAVCVARHALPYVPNATSQSQKTRGKQEDRTRNFSGRRLAFYTFFVHNNKTPSFNALLSSCQTMPRTALKVDHVTEVLRRRVRRGDYLHRPLPTEPALAEETGVSRMTARKAIVRLVEAGLLVRQPHGRVVVNSTPGRLQVALLKPSYEAGGLKWWLNAAHRASEQLDGQKVSVRPVDYVHWDDPVLMNVLEPAAAGNGQGGRYDGILLLPAAELVPQSVVDRLKQSMCPVVVLGRELAQSGLPSLDPCPPDEFLRLFGHLRKLGHRRIDLINTQPHTTGLTIRIDLWEKWRAETEIQGHCYDFPVESYGNTMIAGYDRTRALIKAGKLGSAVFCTTTATALGVMRAAHEMGLRIGKDLSICGADDEGFSRFTVPSITTLTPPDPQPLIKQVLAWIAESGNLEDWPGGPRLDDRLIQGEGVMLFEGESTGPPAT